MKQLRLVFQPGSVPPYITNPYTGCVNCDHSLLDSLNLQPLSSTGESINTQITACVFQNIRDKLGFVSEFWRNVDNLESSPVSWNSNNNQSSGKITLCLNIMQL